MGRKRKNAVYGFFTYDKDSKTSTCLVSGCSSTVKGEHGTNLLYHLSKNHPEEYTIVTQRNCFNDPENSENDKNAQNISGGPSKKARNDCNSQASYLRTQCVNLVTLHGRPFSLMDDLAFKNIIAMTSVTVREQQSINSRSIRTSITDAAENVRKNIAKEVKNKMISLKIDSATRLDRTFFAVNVQYITKGSVTVKTLGVAEMWSRSTSEHLQEKLLHIIRKYHIEVNQIYTITSDNGANMLKLTRLLNEKLNSPEEEDMSDDELEAIEYEDRIYDITLQSENLERLEPHLITAVRCAAHSLQLAVQDSLKEDDMIPSIDEARRIVRKLRTPTMKNLLKSAKKNKAILDNATRWHSTLDMLERLKTLRECCSETPGEPLYLSNVTWDTIDDLINSLKPAKICTKMLQEKQMTIGDFYYQWTKCYLATSHVHTPLAQQICAFMKIREKNLMSNATFASALYLDPRFKVVLSVEEESMAVKHMNATWLHMLKIEAKTLTEETLDNDHANHSSTSSCVDVDVIDVEDEMEQILCQTETERRHEQQVRYIQNRALISEILQNFSHHPRLARKVNILSFWENKAMLEPQLYRLAKTVLAVPATQVSVERLFSALKYVLNNLRSNLNEDIVNDILVIRSNQ